jgi:hypothetical protein
MWWKALVVWLLFMVGAIANGTLRQFVINPAIGAAWGHVISTVLLCAIILGITWASIRWIAPADAGQAWAIGMVWLVMTLAFEFGMGYFISHLSWSEMLADYNVLKGRVWIFVPLVTFIAPWWMAKLRGLLP